MTDKSSENSNNPAPNGSEGEKAEFGSNQNEKPERPAEPSADDVDSLLTSAAEALEHVDDQLGEANIEGEVSDNNHPSSEVKPEKPATQEALTLRSGPPQVSDVDQTLTDMQQEADSLGQQVNAEPVNAHEPTPADNSFDSLSKKENATESAGEDHLNSPPDEENVDDILSAMADELAAETDNPSITSSPTVDNQPSETPSTDVSAADEQAAGEEIDAIFAELEQDFECASDQKDPPQQLTVKSTPDEKSPDKAEGPDAGLTEKQPPAPETMPSTTEVAAAETPSETCAETASEPSGETTGASTAETTVEQKPDIDKDDQIVTQELTDSETAIAPLLDDTPQTPPEVEKNYDHFPLPVRWLIKVIAAVNRPFTFLPPSVRDTLGLIAVITCIVSILAVALLLLL